MIRIAKGISDPVHGSIELSELEARVISTSAFQRLRNVKQLGLASMVFPGADYSRFAHSVGVCHVTQRIIGALRAAGVDISPAEEQQYRLAGLLHDVGHYPFSHAMEEAIHAYYAAKLTGNTDGAVPASHLWLNHEAVGKEVLRHNTEVIQVLRDGAIEPEAIYRIFAREEPPRFANLISSDLDADRIDFLLRTAHHTGLPYGRVDLGYLLTQLRVDRDSQICLHPKALRTADHFLLGRYFDYQQVAYHKTVAALEWILIEVLKVLLAEDRLDCAEISIKSRINSVNWTSFDDAYVLGLIRDLYATTAAPLTKLMAEAILIRRPPKLVVQGEYFGQRRKEDASAFKSFKRNLEKGLAEWGSRFDVPREQWHIWEGTFKMTKVGSNVAVNQLVDEDHTNQAVRIFNKNDRSSQPIMTDNRSLMSTLADKALYSLRLYVLLPENRQSEITNIRTEILADLNDAVWT